MRRVQGALLCAALTITSIANAGDNVYDANCALCHQVRGAGLSGQFPRLAGRIDVIAAAPAGQNYLIAVVLHGMAGRIVVDGAPIVGVMPGFPAMSDADVAAVLNHVAGLGDGKGKRPPRISARAVAAVRSSGALSATEVLTRRTELVSQGVVPP